MLIRTQDMLKKARVNAQKSNITNVEFVASKITSIPLPDSSTDVVISNCVINLVPHTEKPQVFQEIFRILKSGGRVAVSDILAKKDFTEQMRNDIALYVGCVAGASKVEEYQGWMKEAGLQDVLIVDAGSDLNVYTQVDAEGEAVGAACCGPVSTKEVKKSSCCGGGDKVDGGVVADLQNLRDTDLNEWAGEYFPSTDIHFFIS